MKWSEEAEAARVDLGKRVGVEDSGIPRSVGVCRERCESKGRERRCVREVCS